MINIAYISKNMAINGISTVIMNYCRNIDKDKFKITILAGSPISKCYLKECNSLGINIIELPQKIENPKKYYFELNKVLKNNRFDIVHVHGNSATITAELFISWINGVKVRIAHSHNSTCNHIKMHKLLHPFFDKLYTHGFACSSLAGKWLFGNKKEFYIIPNGFNVERFKFNLDNRNQIRKKLNLSNDDFLIGHIGRFNNQKNHLFLLKVFEEVAQKNDKSYLILVGGGPDFDKINQLIKQHQYNDRIIVYGETNQTEKIYSAMDLFVFPSKFEGLGIVALEAQISGLPCCVSDVVPNDIIISDNVKFLSIQEQNIDEWVDEILISHISLKERIECHNSNIDRIKFFDIKENAKYLESLYVNFFYKKEE